MKLQPKQVDRHLVAALIVENVPVAAGAVFVNASAELTSASLSAGRGGKPVPFQQGSGGNQGFVLVGANIVHIFDYLTKRTYADANGNVVYGKHNVLGAVEFFVNVGGTETFFTFTEAQNITIVVPYRFDFDSLPEAAFGGQNFSFVANDPNAGARPKWERVLCTADNVLADLSLAPDPAREIIIEVNGVGYSTTREPVPFTVTGKAVTWDKVKAGFDVTPTDTIVARFWI